MEPQTNQQPENIEELGSILHKEAFPNEDCRGVAGVSECLRKFVKKFHGEINTTSDPTYREIEGGSLRINPDGSFAIWLSPFTAHTRDNFTIAHELGHYFLHWLGEAKEIRDPEGKGKTFHRFGTGEEERQANRFAAAFLMPKEEFREAFSYYRENPYLMSMRFGVSEEAVTTRIKSLGMNDPR